MERGVEFLDEFVQLFTVDIADSKELETLRSPASNVVPLHCLQLSGGRLIPHPASTNWSMAWKWKCSKQQGSIRGYHRYVLNFDDVLNCAATAPSVRAWE